MSEMPVSGNERLQDALVEFTACVGSALDDICSAGLTIGEQYVPFDPDPEEDCDDEDVMCSQVWVRVDGVVPTAVSEGFGGDCAAALQLILEVGVVRCVDVPEDGEAPTATDVLVAAMQAMKDMQALHCAAMGCEVWDSIQSGQWIPVGPSGGQYGGVWIFTVEIS